MTAWYRKGHFVMTSNYRIIKLTIIAAGYNTFMS